MAEQSSDEKFFSLLDEYLDRLHAGEPVDREQLLRERPELGSALECLDVLESFVQELPRDPVAAGGMIGEDNGLSDEQRRQFGPYELIEEIGRGGMGIVYRARQTALDRTVAVKMILGSHVESDEHLRRFQAEAKTAARLRHPNIVHVHEVGQLHGRHYFAMELIEGTSLAQRLTEEPIALDEAVRLMTVTARAVGALHREGIVHRDLKPSNILLDAEDNPYVTDFGLAKMFESDALRTATGVITGTPSYMSPEQAAGHNDQVAAASDIYSLGAMLYEMLTGRPPFRENTPVETILHVISREPVLPRRLNRKVPRGLEQICLKCLAKSPDDRYSSANELADDLDRFAKGEPLEAKTPSWVTRVGRWTRRQPALALRLGALGLFYIVELVNYYFTSEIDKASEFGKVLHLRMSIILAAWAAMSIIFQRLVIRERWTVPACFGWGTIDAGFLLAVLFMADGAASPLVIGYPLLIAGSGLWFRVRFVWYMAVLSLISYGILMVDYYWWHPALMKEFDPAIDRHIIFAVALVVEAFIVGYLVQRLRTLSRYLGG